MSDSGRGVRGAKPARKAGGFGGRRPSNGDNKNKTKPISDFHLPLSLQEHVSILMGLHASSSMELAQYWQRLFIVQQSFAALRSSCTVLDLHDANDAHVLLGHFHAASTCLD